MADIKFITSSGLKSAKKAATHKIDGFMESVYFKEEVLKKYESNKDFSIGDHGTILFGNKWGLFRGVYRVAKGYLATNLGDLGQGLPEKELKHWKQYNVSPSKIPKGERYFDFRDTICRMIYFMNQSNQRIENHLKKFYLDLSISDSNLFDLTQMENTLNNLKKIINKKTSVDEFQVRIIFLNILLLESINTELIRQVFSLISNDLCYSYEKLALKEVYEKYLKKNTPKSLKSNLKGSIDPMRNLRMLQKFLLLLRVHHDVIISLKITSLEDLKKRKKEIYEKISHEFASFYNYKIHSTSFKNKDYFLHNEKVIEEDTKILRLLNRFRNASAAHGFNEKEYKEILKQLGINKETKDYSIINDLLISRVSYDIEHIYFNLISPDPPILDYSKKYLKETLEELKDDNKEYKSTFEELASYLDDFPELYNEMIKKVTKIYLQKKKDQSFIVEFGCFIEMISYSMKEKTQELIEYVLEGYAYNKPLTIAHLSHIIKNSSKITDKFFKRVYSFILDSLKEKDADVDFCSQHVIFCLIEKCPEKLNKAELTEALKNKKVQYDLIKNYISPK